MRRADRLLRLVQALRRRRGAVTAHALAEELEVSVRTVYRDVADLQANGVPVEGAAGLGYVLGRGYDLPPLMFGPEELEAIALGLRLAADRGDAGLARAAEDALAKVAAVMPDTLAERLHRSPLLVPRRGAEAMAIAPHLPVIREGLRRHRKLDLVYVDAQGVVSSRRVWPLGLLFYSHAATLCTWCELRAGFRTFRADRAQACVVSPDTFDPRGGRLLSEFLQEYHAGAHDMATRALAMHEPSTGG